MALSLKLLLIKFFIGTAKSYVPNSESTAFTSGYEKCYGECTNNGTDYYYCSVNNNSNWDYCSPNQQKRPLIKKAFTLENGPCKTPCSWSNRYGYYTCDNYWGTKDDYCETKQWEYIKSYTHKGKECIGTCEKHGRAYYWCYDQDRNDHYCSPYNVEDLNQYISKEMKKIRDSIEHNHGPCQAISRRPRQSPMFTSIDSQAPGQMMAYAAGLAALGSVGRLVSEWRPTESIYQFAFLNPGTPNGPILPLMISARVTSSSLNNTAPRNEANSIPDAAVTNIGRMGRNTNRPDDNNDENGHLIAYQNGGPSEIYNFAPQPRSLNRGIVRGVAVQLQSDWRRSEDSVHNWVSGGNGWVEETVVVVYDDFLRNTRPVGFGQHLVYYYPNDTVRFQCDDYYSNDPTVPPHWHDELL